MAKNGTYRVAYTYAEYNAAGVMVYETGRSPTRTYVISGTQSVSGFYTDNARINRIRIFSTLAGGAVYYLEKVITNVSGTGAWWTTLSMADTTLDDQATAYDLDFLESGKIYHDRIGQHLVRITFDHQTRHAQVTDTSTGEPIPHLYAYWFAWQAFYPDTRLLTHRPSEETAD